MCMCKRGISREETNMVDQNTFMETVRAVAQIVQTAQAPMGRQEVMAYFEDMELTDAQKDMVYQYLIKEPDQPQAGSEAMAEGGIRLADAGGSTGADAQETKRDRGGVSAQAAEDEDPQVQLPQSKFFRMYLEDIESVKLCSSEEEDELYRRLAAGEESAVEQLSKQWLGRVLALAKRHVDAPEHLQDVIQEGNIAVFVTLRELLGCGRKADCRSVLTKAAEEAMDAYLLESAGAEDARQTILAKAALVHEAQKHLAKQLQRMPTNEELGWYTKMPLEEVEDVLAITKEKTGA